MNDIWLNWWKWWIVELSSTWGNWISSKRSDPPIRQLAEIPHLSQSANWRRSAGFTMIELLVTISIIAVLAAFTMVTFQSSQVKARDAARKSDISQIQKALELYKNSQTPPSYPANLTGLGPDQIKSLPQDPRSASGWPGYNYARDETDSLKYTIWACLENTSDPQQDTVQASCPAACITTAGGVCYTRTEP